ncbi:MAG: DNA methyltransferase, partial [Planctomycetota bacterium]
MSLSTLTDQLAWPAPQEILRPRGAGPGVLASLATEKIGKAIGRELGGSGRVKVGVLTRNPRGVSSEAPIAVVCEFSRPATDSILQLAHRLAWNFCRAPLLVTVEPHQVRAWTCCEYPARAGQSTLLDAESAEIIDARLDLREPVSQSEAVSHALHWVHLVSGSFFRQHPNRFPRDGRADSLLLDYLKYIRRRLQRLKLDDDVIHDLLARVIFIQFLFDRKDADGNAALNPGLLARLHHKEKVLSRPYSDLYEILDNYDDAYALFRWLNVKFNGDLFPGKGKTQKEREGEWQAEMCKVQAPHLRELSGFVSGRMHRGQRLLWPMYAFDVIPLEFISSIYEEFVTAAGAHYTPGVLVDFVLDGVLPWEGTEWNLKILDPACGSGIFLVKAYQRLIHRWKNAHDGEKPSAALLRQILEGNLFGVDIDPAAVRVASFSLYLAMCDEIDPKYYWKSVKFPRLRDNRLVHSDFFKEDRRG